VLLNFVVSLPASFSNANQHKSFVKKFAYEKHAFMFLNNILFVIKPVFC